VDLGLRHKPLNVSRDLCLIEQFGGRMGGINVTTFDGSGAWLD